VLRDIPKFSARSAFESPALVLPCHWKALAFEHSVNSFCGSSKIRNVVSFGDSKHDRAALFMAAQKVPGIWGKSLKLVERPDAEHVVKQLEFIRESFQTLTHHLGALDLCIQCHVRAPPRLEGNAQYVAPPVPCIDASDNVVAPSRPDGDRVWTWCDGDRVWTWCDGARLGFEYLATPPPLYKDQSFNTYFGAIMNFDLKLLEHGVGGFSSLVILMYLTISCISISYVVSA